MSPTRMLSLAPSSLLLWRRARLKIASYSTFEQLEWRNLFCFNMTRYFPLGEVPFFSHFFLPPTPHSLPITPVNGAQASFSPARWQFFMPRASGTRKNLASMYVSIFYFLARLRLFRFGTAWLTPLGTSQRKKHRLFCSMQQLLSFFIGQFNRNLPPRVILCSKVVFTCFTSFPWKFMTLQEGQLAPGNVFTIKSANYFVDNHSEGVFSHNELFFNYLEGHCYAENYFNFK